MREIKFKVSNGAEQVIVHSIYQDKGDNRIWWALDENDEWFMCSEPRQYTGLKDKNGREIYEGDILENHNGEKGRFLVVWCGSGFELEYTFNIRGYEEINHFPIHGDTRKIVGNIHENPELLGEKNHG